MFNEEGIDTPDFASLKTSNGILKEYKKLIRVNNSNGIFRDDKLLSFLINSNYSRNKFFSTAL